MVLSVQTYSTPGIPAWVLPLCLVAQPVFKIHKRREKMTLRHLMLACWYVNHITDKTNYLINHLIIIQQDLFPKSSTPPEQASIEAVNFSATCLLNQMTWYYNVLLCVYRNGHHFIKRTTNSLKFSIPEIVCQIMLLHMLVWLWWWELYVIGIDVILHIVFAMFVVAAPGFPEGGGKVLTYYLA